MWFNQANLFHVASLEPEVVRELYGEENLPRNATHAVGRPIADTDTAAIATAYDKVRLAMEWRPGDIMMINNMLMAHGRQPYIGDGRILVAMSEH